MKRLRVCPYCEEKIKVTAIKCRYCGNFLSVETHPTTEVDKPWYKYPLFYFLGIYNLSMLFFWLASETYDVASFQVIFLIIDCIAAIHFSQRKHWARTYLIVRILYRLLPMSKTTFLTPTLFGFLEIPLLCYFLVAFLKRDWLLFERFKNLIGVMLLAAFLFSTTYQLIDNTKIYDILRNIPHEESIYSMEGFKIQLPSSDWKVVEGENAETLYGDPMSNWDTKLARNDGKLFGLMTAYPYYGIDFEWKDVLEETVNSLDQSKITISGQEEHESTASFQVNFSDGSEEYLGIYKFIKLNRIIVTGYFWGYKEDFLKDFGEVDSIYKSIEERPLRDYGSKTTPQDIFNKYNNAVVLIRAYGKDREMISFGSGVILSRDGYILTNLHNVLEATSFDVKFSNGAVYEEGSISALSETDLVLLKISGSEFPFIDAEYAMDIQTGDKVFVIGNPEGLINTLSEGIVSSLREGDNIKLYQITAPVSAGSSGSPVFDAYGRLLGIATFIIEGGQNLNFCISADEIPKMSFLEKEMTLQEFQQAIRETETEQIEQGNAAPGTNNM